MLMRLSFADIPVLVSMPISGVSTPPSATLLSLWGSFPSSLLTELLVDPSYKIDQASLLFERKKQISVSQVQKRTWSISICVDTGEGRVCCGVRVGDRIGLPCASIATEASALLHHSPNPFLHERCRAPRVRVGRRLQDVQLSSVVGSWLRCLHSRNGYADHVPTYYMYLCAKRGLRILRISSGKQTKFS